MARDLRRQLASAQSFSASAPVSFDLPRDSVYKEINLRLEYQVSVPGAMTPASAQFDRAPWSNIKRIELIADGKDTIKSYDGGTLVDINQSDFHAYPFIGDITPGAGANTGALNMGLVISLESVGMQFPQHTWLDARKLSSLELRVTFGAGLADIYLNVGNATLDTFRLTPYGHEILDISDKSAFSVAQETMQTFAFPTNTATARQFRLNVGNSYRRVHVSTVDSNARAAVDRMQTIALLQNGIFYRRRWDAGMLKIANSRTNQLAVGLGVGDAPGSLPTFPTTGRPGGHRLGVYEVDIAEDGSEEALLDTRGFSDLSLEFDWDGANTTDLIRITPTIYVPAIR